MENVDYCPTCKQQVAYESSNGELYCSVCGRTKAFSLNVALRKADDDRRAQRAKRFKLVAIVLAAVIGGVLLLIAFAMAPERMGKAAYQGFIKGTALFVLLGLGWLVFWFAVRFWRRLTKH